MLPKLSSSIRGGGVSISSDWLIPSVLHAGREYEHEEFWSWDVWSLFKEFTSALNDCNLAELPKRTEGLRGHLDVAVGLATKFSTT